MASNQDKRAIAPPKTSGDETRVRYRLRVLGTNRQPIGTLWISMTRAQDYRPFEQRDWQCSATLTEEEVWSRRLVPKSSKG